MAEWISHQSAGSLIALVAVTGGMLIALVCIAGGLWTNARHTEYLARRTEWEVTLKREMVAKGMTADEIERVMKSSPADPAEDAAEGVHATAGCMR